MPFDLVLPRLPFEVDFRPLVYGGWNAPTGGGEEQWLGRLGTRWALDVSLSRLPPEPQGRQLADLIAEALTMGDTVRLPVPMPGSVLPSHGTPVINGASQTGREISIRGFPAAFTVRRGRWFSLTVGGRSYLHQIAADRTTDAAGVQLIRIRPALRVVPPDGAPCEFVNPIIEGKLVADGWGYAPARLKPLRFSIEEVV